MERKYPQLKNKQLLEKLYWDQNLSARQISELLGTGHHRNLLDQMKKFGIIRRKNIANQTGETNSNWKGGRKINHHGYVEILKHEHPKCDHKGYVLEHRVVWEEYHKACLLPWAHVHHKNNIRTDNQIENLEAMTKGQHIAVHSKGKPKTEEHRRKISESLKLRQWRAVA